MEFADTYNPSVGLPPVREGVSAEGNDKSPEALALRVVTADIEVAREANDSEKTRRAEAYELYRAMGDGAEDRPGRSQTKSSDVMDMIEWLMPSLMRAFFGSKSAISVEPIGSEDIVKAELFQKLLNWQFIDKGNGFRVGHEWMKSSLIYGVSPVKVTWQDVYVKKGFAFPELIEPQFEALRSDGNVESLTADNVRVDFVPTENPLGPQINTFGPQMLPSGTSNATPYTLQPYQLEPMRVYENVRGEERIKVYSGPLVEVIPPEDFFIDPEARDINEARFVIHRVKRTVTYLKQKEREGIYSNISKVIEGNTNSRAYSDEDDSETAMRATNSNDYSYYTSRNDLQKARRKINVWEWWGLLDVNDTGIAEPYLVVVANGVVIRMEKNPYAHGEPPFEVMRPILDIFTINGISIVDLVGEYQKIKTALMRQTLDNISFQNNQMWLVDENAGVDLNGLAHPRPCKIILTNNLNGVKQITPAPLEGSVFNVMEFIQSQLEQRTGITRYNQGLSADSLNKMLALDTPIPMADGTVKLNKDIVAGDMIIGSDGNPTEVLKAHPVQMPKRAFAITFESGEVIRAGGEHLWTVAVRTKKKSFSAMETLPTERIYELVQSGHRVIIPRVKAVEYPEKELPVDPYILGVWLGDGHSHASRFTNADDYIVERVRKWAEQFYKGGLKESSVQNSGKAKTYDIINTPFRQMMLDLGVMRDSRYNDNEKHIPEMYMTASKEQRLELLRGLMDTDGHRYKYRARLSGYCVYCTSSERLRDDVSNLILSLGGIPKITKSIPRNQMGGPCKEHYHVSFSMLDCPFALPRKADVWAPVRTATVQHLVSIEEIPVEPMRCLSVAAKDRMYCCGKKFTLTRNTATGINAIMNASSQRIELIARVMAETGFRRLYRKMLQLDQQFVDQKIMIRVYGKPLEISPDDLAGNFDVSVDIGGATNRDQQEVQQMMTLLNYSQLFLQLGVMRPENIYQATKKILTIWGVAEADKYIADPNDTQVLRQIIADIDNLGVQIQQGQAPDFRTLVKYVIAARQALAKIVSQDVSEQNPQPGVAPEGQREMNQASAGNMTAYANGTIAGGPGNER